MTSTNKIDPITAVQDSIDALALSLFEALRGVRDAVAPESLSAATPTPPKEEVEPITSETARGELKQILTEGTEIPHDYLNRASDMLEPDYYAFILSYLSGEEYSKALVERFRDLEASVAADTSTTLPVKQEVDSVKQDSKGLTNEVSKISENDIGYVGYEFRKLFDAGWFEGKVIEIRPLADGGKDRRVLYSDGDMEDLTLDDLRDLAKLDPRHTVKKPRLSIKLKLNRSNSSSGMDTKADQSTTNNVTSIPKIPRTEKEYVKLLQQYELERDTQITQQLAQNVLTKSADVNNLVANLPGMDRTRMMQMARIEELIDKNQVVAKELEEAYELATKRRSEVRAALEEHTCSALGLS